MPPWLRPQSSDHRHMPPQSPLRPALRSRWKISLHARGQEDGASFQSSRARRGFSSNARANPAKHCARCKVRIRNAFVGLLGARRQHSVAHARRASGVTGIGSLGICIRRAYHGRRKGGPINGARNTILRSRRLQNFGSHRPKLVTCFSRNLRFKKGGPHRRRFQIPKTERAAVWLRWSLLRN